MIKIIAIIGVVLAVAVVAVLAYATTRPDSFSVQRATTHQGAAGEDLRAARRFPRLERLVALGEDGSRR